MNIQNTINSPKWSGLSSKARANNNQFFIETVLTPMFIITTRTMMSTLSLGQLFHLTEKKENPVIMWMTLLLVCSFKKWLSQHWQLLMARDGMWTSELQSRLKRGRRGEVTNTYYCDQGGGFRTKVNIKWIRKT